MCEASRCRRTGATDPTQHRLDQHPQTNHPAWLHPQPRPARRREAAAAAGERGAGMHPGAPPRSLCGCQPARGHSPGRAAVGARRPSARPRGGDPSGSASLWHKPRSLGRSPGSRAGCVGDGRPPRWRGLRRRGESTAGLARSGSGTRRRGGTRAHLGSAAQRHKMLSPCLFTAPAWNSIGAPRG